MNELAVKTLRVELSYTKRMLADYEEELSKNEESKIRLLRRIPECHRDIQSLEESLKLLEGL